MSVAVEAGKGAMQDSGIVDATWRRISAGNSWKRYTHVMASKDASGKGKPSTAASTKRMWGLAGAKRRSSFCASGMGGVQTGEGFVHSCGP